MGTSWGLVGRLPTCTLHLAHCKLHAASCTLEKRAQCSHNAHWRKVTARCTLEKRTQCSVHESRRQASSCTLHGAQYTILPRYTHCICSPHTTALTCSSHMWYLMHIMVHIYISYMIHTQTTDYAYGIWYTHDAHTGSTYYTMLEAVVRRSSKPRQANRRGSHQLQPALPRSHRLSSSLILWVPLWKRTLEKSQRKHK